MYRSIVKEKDFIDDFFVDNIINERKKFLLHILEQKKEYDKELIIIVLKNIFKIIKETYLRI